MLSTVLEMAEPALRAETALDASMALHDALAKRGVTYLQSRLYRRPIDVLTSESHWAAGGFVARVAPPSWPGSAAFNYVCFDCNPLLEPIRRGMTRYRFSDFASPDDARFVPYWDAMSEGRIGDALCATAYGPNRWIVTFHIGFDRPTQVSGALGEAVQGAAQLVAERMIRLNAVSGTEQMEPVLSERERDALLYVALGKTDWEISTILGIAESTARFHVDNARRKLGATNRAHAVARLMAMAGPI